MSAYQVGNVKIKDPEGFAEYAAQVPEMIERRGGRYLARGGEVHVMEGDWYPGRVVIVEWDSVEQAKGWYDSPEYQAAAEIRRRSADTRLMFVEGL